MWSIFAGVLHGGHHCPQDDVTDALYALEVDPESFEAIAPRDYRIDNGKQKVGDWWFEIGNVVAVYKYRDESGATLYEKLRYQKNGSKEFKQRRGPISQHPEHGGLYYDRLGDVRLVPYRLPELIAADPAAIVLMVEGEKAADRLSEMGFVVTIYKRWE